MPSPTDPADTNDTLATFRRYADLLPSLLSLPESFAPTAEDATALQVERGELLPLTLLHPDTPSNAFTNALSSRVERLIELTRSPDRLGSLAVVDHHNHHRPLYRPILVYALLQSFRLLYERLPQSQFGRWEESSRAWADLLEAELTTGRTDASTFLASRGAPAAEMAWTALALHVAGKAFVRDAFSDLAADFFGRLNRAQQPDGAFLATTPSDNPETTWYHELALLHAAASFAVQSEDRSLASAVRRSTEYHLNETQPDHASTHPFGLFAFLWNPTTRPLADQLLHATQTQHPGGASGLPSILLADTLHSLRLFL